MRVHSRLASAARGKGRAQPTVDATNVRDDEQHERAGAVAPLADVERLTREAADATSENRQLRLAVQALREELERQHIAGRARLDESLGQANDENRQLRQTAQALRDELERVRIAGEERLNEALGRANDENRQLRETVQALRDEMDRLRILADEAATLHRRDLADAHTHIQALRDQLEVLRARDAE